MQARMLKALEFDKVKAQLLEHVSSSLGREKVERLVPSSDFVQVVQWQEETDEAVLALRLRGYAPLGGIFDIRSSLKRAKIGGTLSAHELLDIASTIYASRQMKQFIDALNDEKEGICICCNMPSKWWPSQRWSRRLSAVLMIMERY